MPSHSAVPGAVVDDAGLRHLGNPLGEQRALAAGAAIAPLGDRDRPRRHRARTG